MVMKQKPHHLTMTGAILCLLNTISFVRVVSVLCESIRVVVIKHTFLHLYTNVFVYGGGCA